MVDATTALNAIENDVVHDPEIATRIAQYEMAFRMQSSVPSLIDFSNEPANILELYGTKGEMEPSQAIACLLGDWLSEAFDSFSFITATGIIMGW